jgi:phosphatidylglycerophosphate synthase
LEDSSRPPHRLQALVVWPQGSEPAQRSRLCGVPLEARAQRLLAAAGLEIRSALSEIDAGRPLLLVRGDWMVDRRLLQALSAAGGPVGVRSPEDRGWIARVTPAKLAAQPGEPSGLLAEQADLPEISPATVDPYVQTSRRSVPVRLLPLRSPTERTAAEAAIMADAQKGVLDWPARFVHAPVENFVARLLWPTPVTPNQISLATFAIGLAAAGLFAAGLVWPALLAALVCGALDGVDGKLARTKLLVSAAGEWEHVGDKVVEYLWYLGLGAGLARLTGSWVPLGAGVVATIAMGADVVVGTAAQKRLGRQLDDVSSFDRAFRLVAARRNTNMWMLLAFAVFGAWRPGLFAIAALAVLSVSVHLVRLTMAARALAADKGVANIGPERSGGT